MVPQAGAVTPVGQVTLQVAFWLLDPLTKGVNVWVVPVTTLAVVGEIDMVMVDAVPPPHPTAPSSSATIIIQQYFHRLMPVLQRPSNIRSATEPCRDFAPEILSRCKVSAPHP